MKIQIEEMKVTTEGYGYSKKMIAEIEVVDADEAAKQIDADSCVNAHGLALLDAMDIDDIKRWLESKGYEVLESDGSEVETVSCTKCLCIWPRDNKYCPNCGNELEG